MFVRGHFFFSLFYFLPGAILDSFPQVLSSHLFSSFFPPILQLFSVPPFNWVRILLFWVCMIVCLLYLVCIIVCLRLIGPPLWSSGKSFWLLTQGSRVRFPALPDFSEQQWVWNGVHSASWTILGATWKKQ
jgi:hypothetical protein